MTRIISGSARGRTLRVPKAGTRPTPDRVRESLFSALEHQLGSWSGRHVLDLFAGSGALALEALSRGAQSAVLVESSRAAAQVCRDNIATTGFDARVVQTDAFRWVAKPATHAFGVVFADPPYGTPEPDVQRMVAALADHGWIADAGVLVIERPAAAAGPNWPAGFALTKERRFGDTVMHTAIWYVSTD